MDEIKIEVLEDGTLKITTPKISGANHANADAFLRTTQLTLGGETVREKRGGDSHTHHHHSDHVTHKH